MIRFLGALLLAVLATTHAWAGVENIFEGRLVLSAHSGAIQAANFHSLTRIEHTAPYGPAASGELSACCTGKEILLTPAGLPCAFDNIVLHSPFTPPCAKSARPDAFFVAPMNGSQTDGNIFRPPIS